MPAVSLKRIFFSLCFLLVLTPLFASLDIISAAARTKIRYLLPDRSAAVFFSGTSVPVWNTAEGTSFFRMTGLNQDRQILVVLQNKITFRGQQVQEILFVPATQEWPPYWTGVSTGIDVLKQLSGIEVILNLDEFPSFLEEAKRNQWIETYLLTNYPGPGLHSPFTASYDKAIASLRTNLNIPFAWSPQLEAIYKDAYSCKPAEYERIAGRASNYLAYYPELRQDSLLQAIAQMRSATTLTRLKSEIEKIKADITVLPGLLHKLTDKKSPEEIELLRNAARQGSRAMDEWIRSVSIGASTSKLSALWNLLSAGSQHTTDAGSALSGKNTLMPHVAAPAQILQSGELVRLQGISRYMGYRVEFVRTLPVSGRYSQEQKTLTGIVLKAQEAAIKSLRPGVRISEINDVMRKSIFVSLKDAGIIKNEADLNKYIHESCIDQLTLSDYESGSDEPLESGALLRLKPSVSIFPQSPCAQVWWNLSASVSDPVLLTSVGAEFLDLTLPRTPAELEARVLESGAWENLLK